MAPSKQLYVSEFYGDFDKIVAAALLVGMSRSKPATVDVLGVAANMFPATEQARLGKGILRQLGADGIPVAIGSDCKKTSSRQRDFDVPFAADVDDLMPDAEELFLRSCQELPKQEKLGLVVTGALTDVAEWARRHPETFASRVGSVALMSGVEATRGAVSLSTDGLLMPDHAVNNKKDMSSAVLLFRQLQSMRIPMTVVSRHAAVAAAMPRSFFDDLAHTGHPLGKWIRDGAANYERQLYQQACLPRDSAERTLGWGSDEDPRNEEWYRRTRCSGNNDDLSKHDGDVWQIVTSVPEFNSATLMASVPSLRDRFFEPTVVEVDGVRHRIIGIDANNTGVRDEDAVRSFMKDRVVQVFGDAIRIDPSLASGRAVQRREAGPERHSASDVASDVRVPPVSNPTDRSEQQGAISDAGERPPDASMSTGQPGDEHEARHLEHRRARVRPAYGRDRQPDIARTPEQLFGPELPTEPVRDASRQQHPARGATPWD